MLLASLHFLLLNDSSLLLFAIGNLYFVSTLSLFSFPPLDEPIEALEMMTKFLLMYLRKRNVFGLNTRFIGTLVTKLF